MQFKKVMVLAILIVSLLAISTVSAADNVTDDIGSANDELVNIDDADDSLKSNPKTFSQLNGLINDNNDNDVYLDGNYAFKPGTDNGFKQGIVVDRNVTIWGKGFTLDGNNAARIFNVKCRDVVFRDVVFVNGKATDYGGAINGECSVVNCTFIDNSARNGGAIYSNGNCDLINCVFSRNTAMYGGAVYTIWGNFFARECKFSLNDATEEIYYSTGGAIFLYESNCSLIDVQFDNNSAHDYGCAIEQDCWNESYFTAINCSFKNHVSGAQTVIVGNNSSFINCSFVNNHGAIRCKGLSNVSNCYFENNFMEYGGAIYLSEGYCYLTNCSFKNSIGNNSDALFCLRSNCFVKNCNFLNSDIRSQYNEGLALASGVINCSFINSINEATGPVFDCKFINSTTQSYGIITNCSFKDKSAVSTIINYEEGVFISWDCDVVNCSFTDSFCGCVKLIANCSFENNTVSSAVGLLGIAEVINCSFINNHARAISGDGTGLNVSIINCNFLNNSANKGGAVYLYSGEVVIRNCNFIGNRAINNDTYMDGGGGAVLLVDCLTTIDNCSFINNSKIGENKLDVNHGGAVSIEGVYFREISCSISNSNFVNNTGINGGAIHSESSSLSVDNSTFVSNSAIGYYTSNDGIPFPYISSGGAISYCNGNFNVNNCTFEKNYADSYGSAIACSVANAVISNSIFSGNVAKGKNKTFYEITSTDKKDNYSSKHFGNSTVFFESVYGKNTIVIENCSEFIKNDERFKTTTILDTSEIEVIMAFNQNYNLIVTFKKPNRIELKGFDVSMKLDGNTYNFKTNSKGQFNKVIKLNPGKYNAIISYGGNNDYKKATLTVKFIVTKATPKLTASKKTFKKSVKTKKYTVTLKNNKNEVMKYTQVSLKVNKKTYKVKTNSKGQATFKITNLNKKGTFTAVVKYDGSKYYYSKTVKPKIIVK